MLNMKLRLCGASTISTYVCFEQKKTTLTIFFTLSYSVLLVVLSWFNFGLGTRGSLRGKLNKLFKYWLNIHVEQFPTITCLE